MAVHSTYQHKTITMEVNRGSAGLTIESCNLMWFRNNTHPQIPIQSKTCLLDQYICGVPRPFTHRHTHSAIQCTLPNFYLAHPCLHSLITYWHPHLSWLQNKGQSPTEILRHTCLPQTYKNSFFPHTVREWNYLDASLVGSPSVDSFRECPKAPCRRQ